MELPEYLAMTASEVSSVTDRLGHSTQYSYDANRNQTSMTDALNHMTTFSYDRNNQLVGMLDANNQQTTWQRDIQARDDGENLSGPEQ